MAEQKITIKIGGHPYPLKATSPEHEETMRKAADELNCMIQDYQHAYADKTLREIVSLSALNVAIGRIVAKKELAKFESEVKSLERVLESYLDNMDKHSR